MNINKLVIKSNKTIENPSLRIGDKGSRQSDNSLLLNIDNKRRSISLIAKKYQSSRRLLSTLVKASIILKYLILQLEELTSIKKRRCEAIVIVFLIQNKKDSLEGGECTLINSIILNGSSSLRRGFLII